MSESQTLLLGLVAGATIMFGLPVGRLRRPLPRLRQFLSAVAVGILVFLVWDVLTSAYQPIGRALARLHDGSGGALPVIGYAALFFTGIGLGLIGLLYYGRYMARRAAAARSEAQARLSPGPGAAAANQVSERGTPWLGRLGEGERLALLIAVGIGLHNFGEGLAIGSSAGRGELALATLLVIGFGLHNTTEGFGIVAPLAAEGRRPGWGWLLALGAIGGGPTFVGTAVGRQFTSNELSVLFLTLAAGSIIYVVVQLLGVARKAATPEILYWGLFVGLVAGFVTDMVVSAAGA